MSKTVLKIKDLKINFSTYAGQVQAIRDVDLKIKSGEITCLVGESGSGKSVLCKSIMGLLPLSNTRFKGGKIIIDDIDILQIDPKDYELIRGNLAALIFQDPMTSLNPVMAIGKQIKEALLIHHLPTYEEYIAYLNNESNISEEAKQKLIKSADSYKEEIEQFAKFKNETEETFRRRQKEIKNTITSREQKDIAYKENVQVKLEALRELRKLRAKLHKMVYKGYYNNRVVEFLDLVGIKNPKAMAKQYPHQLSGGMRQRIVIAIALACEPKLLICDEPTTALDVTIQAQILELIKDLQKKLNFAVLFVTHDLGVVANVADYVSVMYAGKIVESASCLELFYNPAHPYTWGLLASMPDLELDTKEELFTIDGTPPNLLNPPIGDAFAPRNRFAMDIDFKEHPPMFKITDTHYAATWLLDKRAPQVQMPEAIAKKIEFYRKRSQNEQ